MLATMTFVESLNYFSLIAQIPTNVVVAAYVFPMWQKYRQPFFLLLSFSALLGIFTAVANWAFEHRPMSEGEAYWLWCAIKFLNCVNLILYAVGITLMVRHYTKIAQNPGSQAGPL